MKTLELNLKKDVLIVDENDFDYYEIFKEGVYFKLENGDREYLEGEFEFLCKGSELTEEIASELVEMEYSGLYKKSYYIDYDRPSLLLKFAKESFISAVESKEKFWLENPIEKPINRDEFYKSEKVDSFEILLKEWQESEEKTFRNPLIFVKK